MLTEAQLDFLREHQPGFDPDTWSVALAGAAGSQRRFVRLEHGATRRILMIWDSTDRDWSRCLGIHDAVHHLGLIPEIFATNATHGLILEEDLGGITLKSRVERGDALPAFCRVIEALIRWQSVDPASHPILPARVMDFADLRWESDYFAQHCVATHCGLPTLLTPVVQDEFEQLAREADAIPKVWMHRDFQSENIMVINDTIRVVDYQGARLGPHPYDLASLLYDPYLRVLSLADRQSLLATYQAQCPHATNLRDIQICACQRLMQALGAYGKLAHLDGKQHYLQYIPLALRRLQQVLRDLSGLTELMSLVTACIAACPEDSPTP